jgi:hypothetical protein
MKHSCILHTQEDENQGTTRFLIASFTRHLSLVTRQLFHV